jgi:hypothetical protein
MVKQDYKIHSIGVGTIQSDLDSLNPKDRLKLISSILP